MKQKEACLLYLDSAKSRLINDFPNNKELTDDLFIKVYNFVDTDFQGVSENKVFRIYLNTLKEVVELAFQKDASKSYMRNVFKQLNNEKLFDYLSIYINKKSTDVKFLMNKLVNFFVYQDTTRQKESILNEIIEFIDMYM